MKINNKEEVDKWLFEHANIQGHNCKGIKGMISDDEVNVAFIDMTTNERINITYANNLA